MSTLALVSTPTTPLLRVTEILRLAGLVDARFYTEDGRLRGQWVHEICASLDRGQDPGPYPDALKGYVAAWLKFKADTGFVPRLVEHEVVHRVYQFRGHLDVEGTIPGQDRPIVVDRKTGVPAPWAAIQTAGYALALGAKPRHARWIVQLCEDGAYKVTKFSDAKDEAVFLSALVISKWRVRHNARLVHELHTDAV